LNDSWAEKDFAVEAKVVEFENSISAAAKIFGMENVGRKWTGEKFEKNFNRAVFDVIVFYFADDKIRSAALEEKDSVLNSFKTLCASDIKFRNSIESTTKSMISTSSRFNRWGDELKKALGMDFQVPILIDNRIKFTGFWR
jgi:hypothetical protein